MFNQRLETTPRRDDRKLICLHIGSCQTGTCHGRFFLVRTQQGRQAFSCSQSLALPEQLFPSYSIHIISGVKFCFFENQRSFFHQFHHITHQISSNQNQLVIIQLISYQSISYSFDYIITSIKSGWWFGTFFISPYIGNDHPN